MFGQARDAPRPAADGEGECGGAQDAGGADAGDGGGGEPAIVPVEPRIQCGVFIGLEPRPQQGLWHNRTEYYNSAVVLNTSLVGAEVKEAHAEQLQAQFETFKARPRPGRHLPFYTAIGCY